MPRRPACGGAPRLNSPAAGGQVNLLQPTLVIDNASDPDEDRLTYTFEGYREPALTTLVAAEGGVGAGANTTSWQVALPLSEAEQAVRKDWDRWEEVPESLRPAGWNHQPK